MTKRKNVFLMTDLGLYDGFIFFLQGIRESSFPAVYGLSFCVTYAVGCS